jgi:hypothetical protein
MSDYSTTGAKNGRDYGARHSVLRDSIVLRHGCVLAYGQRAPRAPHRKCRESVAGILTEKSLGDVAARTEHVPWVRTCHVSEPATSFFSRNFSDRPPASDSRGALQSLNVRNRRTRILLTRGVIALLRPPARQPCFSLGPNTLALIHACDAIHSLRPRKLAGSL